MNKTIHHYNLKSDDFFKQYESISAENIHNSWINYIDNTSGFALDIGAGSGRDALWLANMGFDVVAVEPAEKLRNLAKQHNHNENITWIDDSLLELKATYQLNIKFDLILLSAVWMHIPEISRKTAFNQIANLLSPSGKLVISLRHGLSPDEREMYKVSFSEISILAKKHSLKVIKHQDDSDKLQRGGINWETVLLEHS